MQKQGIGPRPLDPAHAGPDRLQRQLVERTQARQFQLQVGVGGVGTGQEPALRALAFTEGEVAVEQWPQAAAHEPGPAFAATAALATVGQVEAGTQTALEDAVTGRGVDPARRTREPDLVQARHGPAQCRSSRFSIQLSRACRTRR